MDVKRIKYAMIYNDYDQARLAEDVGVSAAEISHILNERRKPSAEIVKRLCISLHVSADWLLGLDEYEELSDVVNSMQGEKTGKWIESGELDNFAYCSECEDTYYELPLDPSWRYCPHCGAKMEN